MLITDIDIKNKNILVTGAAGFIGSNLILQLLHRFNNIGIVGLDNINNYYDISIKENRLNEINREYRQCKNNKWVFIKGDICDKKLIDNLFRKYNFSIVINLAAQAGVRYSIENPELYINSNIVGFFNIIETCRYYPVEHLIYASSSSVYGLNNKIPYSVKDKTDLPISLYAATKKADELIAYSYSQLFNIPSTGLRLFTVYGPNGRPDMAYFKFTDKLLKGEKIELFNYGQCKRDFTYIDDVVECILRVIGKPPKNKEEGENNVVPFKIYNIGNNCPETLINFVNVLKDELITNKLLPYNYDINNYIELVPMQKGDVKDTYADISPFKEDFGFAPNTKLKDGISNFIIWYKKYYNLG